MKKTYKMDGLDCANCAAKMEASINKLEGVKASVSFMTQKLVLEAPDEIFDETLEKARELIKKVDRHVEVL